VPTDPRVLIDFRTADDAGVYVVGEDLALVQTVDFFTPIVDDPYAFGQIAAANAVSDVYAMGGVPLTALAIAAFPAKDFDTAIVEAIFRGGYDKLAEAGVILLGGHTVQDSEVKFGYAVTGRVRPDRVLSNAGARPGDHLVLTKPIGTGVISTAIKNDRAPADVVRAAIESMTLLNRAAAEILADAGPDVVHACTDITGFGLIGHASEMAGPSGVTLVMRVGDVPLLTGALDLAARNRAGGGATNQAYFGARVREPELLDDNLRALLYDPQTSGGLFAALDPAVAAEVVERLRDAGVSAVRVGTAGPAGQALIELV
jgi:selenide,water dikinase